MVIKIDKNSKVTIIQQLVQCLSDRILSGLIKDGERLPSIRKLSRELEVSPMTIVKAYNELERCGLATTIQGKGTFVNQRNKIDVDKNQLEEDGLQWQMSVVDYLPRSQFRYNPNLSYNNDYFNLSIASINYKLLPIEAILKDSVRYFHQDKNIISKYPPVQGDHAFREAMAKYLRLKEINTTSENILITNGAQQGISLIASTFVGPGDIVVMEAPTYPGAIDLFKCRGASILTVPVDEEGMRTDILMSLCDRYSPKVIYTMPNFQNPTGYSMSIKRKMELLDIARYNNSIIIEDDPWSDISYTNAKVKSLKSMDTTSHVIYIKGLNKILGPTYRLAAVVSEGTILSRLIAAKANHDLGTSILSQKIVLDFIKTNEITNYVQKLNKNLVKRRDTVIRLLKANTPLGATWTIPEGGINIWITLPKNFDVEKLLFHSITTKNISFLPGTICYPNEVEFNKLRICFAYLEEEYLENTIIELCSLMRDLQKEEESKSYMPIV